MFLLPTSTRVAHEVREVLGDREFVTSEDLEKLEYTLQVEGANFVKSLKYFDQSIFSCDISISHDTQYMYMYM